MKTPLLLLIIFLYSFAIASAQKKAPFIVFAYQHSPSRVDSSIKSVHFIPPFGLLVNTGHGLKRYSSRKVLAYRDMKGKYYRIWRGTTYPVSEDTQPFIAFTADQMKHPQIDSNIRNVYSNLSGIVVNYNDGKKIFKESDVWGYRNAAGISTRIRNAPPDIPIVFFTSGQYWHPHIDTGVKRVKISGEYVSVDRDTGKTFYDVLKVWGYRDKDGIDYRIWNYRALPIVQAGGITLYQIMESNNDPDNPSETLTTYFSKGLDSSVYLPTMKNLQSVFGATNPKFISLLKDKISEKKNVMVYDNKQLSFVIAELYEQSLQNPVRENSNPHP